MRYRQETPSGSTIYYIDKLMEIEALGSTVDYRHYLGDVAILTKTGSLNDPSPGIRYLFRDRLGSTSVIGDEYAAIVEYRGFDAFGKPRNGNWTNKAPPTINSTVTDRGFTDHEHLDDWQLIHMNGRGYDYNLGRFLSVDPFIQDPGNSQSINGYSYIGNNPLSGTDPTGYYSSPIAGSISYQGAIRRTNDEPGWLSAARGRLAAERNRILVGMTDNGSSGSASDLPARNDGSSSPVDEVKKKSDWTNGPAPLTIPRSQNSNTSVKEDLSQWAPILLPAGNEAEKVDLETALYRAYNAASSARDSVNLRGLSQTLAKSRYAGTEETFSAYILVDRALFPWNNDTFSATEASIFVTQGGPLAGGSEIFGVGDSAASNVFLTLAAPSAKSTQAGDLPPSRSDWHRQVVNSEKNRIFNRNFAQTQRPILVVTPYNMYLFINGD